MNHHELYHLISTDQTFGVIPMNFQKMHVDYLIILRAGQIYGDTPPGVRAFRQTHILRSLDHRLGPRMLEAQQKSKDVAEQTGTMLHVPHVGPCRSM